MDDSGGGNQVGARRSDLANVVLGSTLRALGLALVSLTLAASALAGLGEATAPTLRDSAASPLAPGHCEVAVRSSYAPARLNVGESVAVTLSLQTGCGESATNIVLVIDGSASGQTRENLRAWADRVVQFVLPLGPLVRVGVVEYNDVATPRCELMRDPTLLGACIADIVASGSSHPGVGLREAHAMFERDRSQDPQVAAVTHQLIILLMGARPVPDCSGVLSVAREAKRRESIIGVCGGPDCDADCAIQVVTPPYYYRQNELAAFTSSLDELMAPLAASTAKITTTLSASAGLVAYAPVVRQEGRTLVWEFEPPTSNALTVTYRARALSGGRYAVSPLAGARVVFRGGFFVGETRRAEFEPAIIDVASDVWFPLLINRR